MDSIPAVRKKPGEEIYVLGRRYVIVKAFHTGYNSAVYEAKNGKKGTEVLKIYGEGVSITTEQVGAFLIHIRDYEWHLRAAGVQLPPFDDRIITTNNGTGDTFSIVVIAPFMGDNYETALKQAENGEACVKIMRLIFRSLGNLFSSTKCKRLKVGIDLIPRNFVGKRATYVDLVPPKIITGKKYLLEWPEVTHPQTRQVGIYRHYDKVGVMHVLLVQMARLRPEFYPLYITEIQRYYKRKKQNYALAQFDLRLVNRSINGQAADAAIIRELGFRQIYDLREIACYYAHRGLISNEQLEDVFKTTHFQDKPLTKAVLRQVRNLLIKAITD